MRRTTRVFAGLAGASLLLGACGSSSSTSSPTTAASGSSGTSATSGTSAASGTSASSGTSGGGSTKNPSMATSVAAYGGMKGLIAAAKKEGTLNVIALPPDWANYGAIISTFEKTYGIKVVSSNPDGTSAEEISAIKELKGQSRAPDVVDVGLSFAATGAADGDFAPYKVATWKNIPADEKDANGDYYGDYGGFIAIGYNSAKVKTPPTSMKSLLNPMYKNEVGINGDPTEASAAFSAVYAAALANGGSLSNITPGIKYFEKLKQEGNYVAGTSSASTVENGQTPILIWWDYLMASEVATQVKTWKVVIPSDAHYAAYYDQAISSSAPHPAAARLWEEFLYSTVGQNLWLAGQARPVELPAMLANGTANKAAAAKLPPAPAKVALPTNAQLNAADTTVAQQWSQVGS
jgi:putative spermidine/putrescine transport system substrate-binding protein